VRLALSLLIDPIESGEELHDLTVRKSVRIDVEGEPQPVQADGEVIGKTPVEVVLVPGLLRVLAPHPAKT
jgi:diacylglycerol kinase family enzyme